MTRRSSPWLSPSAGAVTTITPSRPRRLPRSSFAAGPELRVQRRLPRRPSHNLMSHPRSCPHDHQSTALPPTRNLSPLQESPTRLPHAPRRDLNPSQDHQRPPTDLRRRRPQAVEPNRSHTPLASADKAHFDQAQRGRDRRGDRLSHVQRGGHLQRSRPATHLLLHALQEPRRQRPSRGPRRRPPCRGRPRQA